VRILDVRQGDGTYVTIRARVWRGLAQEGALKRTLDEHHAILDAPAGPQAEVARALATVHIAGVEQWLRTAL
jgi:GntR family transcriptional repressor for pyruvate dehydrogenase complex